MQPPLAHLMIFKWRQLYQSVPCESRLKWRHQSLLKVLLDSCQSAPRRCLCSSCPCHRCPRSWQSLWAFFYQGHLPLPAWVVHLYWVPVPPSRVYAIAVCTQWLKMLCPCYDQCRGPLLSSRACEGLGSRICQLALCRRSWKLFQGQSILLTHDQTGVVQ